MLRSLCCVLSAALRAGPSAWPHVLLVLVAAIAVGGGTAEARTTDTIGATTSTASATSACRGVRVLADQDATLHGFDATLANSSGKTLTYYAYESSTLLGTYTVISNATVSKVGTVGASPGWEASPSMAVPVTAGKHYIFAVCWVGAPSAISFSYVSQAGVYSIDLAFGNTTGTVYDTSGSPSASFNWTTTSVRPRIRMHSTAGTSADIEMPYASGYPTFSYSSNGPSAGSAHMRGTYYNVTQTGVLTQFDMLMKVNASAPLTWMVYKCPSYGGCTASPSSYNLVASGTTQATYDANNLAQWVSTEDLNVELEAGYRYWIGYFWTSVSVLYYYGSGADLTYSWGSSDGLAWGSSSAASPPSPYSATVWDGWYAPQHVNVIPNKTDGETTAGCYSYDSWLQGATVLADQNSRIEEMAARADAAADGTVTMAIYEGTSVNSMALVWSRAIEVEGTQGLAWLESGPVDYDIRAGYYYAFQMYTAPGYSVTQCQQSVSGEAVFDIGTRVGGTWVSTSALPTTMTTGLNGYVFDWRVASCDSCADVDDDGYSAATDCNDGNAAINPGATEVCNGWDDNCDWLLNSDEYDGDWDGYIECSGDCDDANYYRNQGAAEECDGYDTDCDGSYPIAEADLDGDTWLACAWNGWYPLLPGLSGGGDCGATDATSYPGATEICDGVDNNCDTGIDSSELDDDGDDMSDCAGDCDDSSTITYDGATEACDGADNDCDGSVPANENNVDGDSYRVCAGDCNDASTAVYPGATEVCNGSDDSCDGVIPSNENNADSDGYRVCAGDCNDASSTIYPAATEACNGVDDSCDGAIPSNENNADGDGYRVCAGDCNDTSATIYPGATEACNGLDDSCDGNIPTNENNVDGDSYRVCAGDCNDTSATTYPTATEACDGADNNCDGSVPVNEANADADLYRVCAGDCDDTRNTIYPAATELCDGWDNNCNGSVGANEVDADGDHYYTCTYVASGGNPAYSGSDCADSAATRYPGAPETCNGVDDNCNGSTTDEGVDADGDGTTSCTDCNDALATVEPGAPEICDGRDSDCTGGVPTTEQDPDSDGYIACTIANNATLPSSVTGGGDCRTADSLSYPGATEQCDGIDNNCNSSVPANENNTDADAYRVCQGDCNDASATVYPGATEACNGADDDCNGAIPTNETNADADAYRICAGDCNDAVATIYPGATEACNGIDDSCDSSIPANENNVDADAYRVCAGDCNDSSATVYPGATEACNGADDSCDGSVPANENNTDADGFRVCAGDCNDAVAATYPGATEICDGADNDCNSVLPANEADGDADTYMVCELDCDDTRNNVYPSATETCDARDNDCDSVMDEGFDVDADGYRTAANAGCVASYASTDCNDAAPTVFPGASESCNGVDDDCDTATDDGFDIDGDGFRTGTDSGCVATYASTDCDDGVASIHPGAAEACDGIDEDCDGTADDGFDGDGDGWRDQLACAAVWPQTDCVDSDASISPGATEVCDGVDEDCDLAIDNGFDLDGDTFFDGADPGCAAAHASTDCDDGQNVTFPGASELCDAADNDCDLLVDESFDLDGDGHVSAETCVLGDDCDDGNPTTFPGSAEVCNGSDDDCNGTPDQGLDLDGDGYFPASNADCLAAYGSLADCDDTLVDIHPFATELCDGADQDCDLVLDNGFDEDGDGQLSAVDCATGTDCNDIDPTAFLGGVEVCDAADDDCDGVVDDGFDLDGDLWFDGADPGCVGSWPLVDCDDAAPAVYPGHEESCDGVDEDCDGVVPEEEGDGDADGYVECASPSHLPGFGGDCDDTNGSVSPGATEICNGLNDDCVSGVDNGFDADGDFHFDRSVGACEATYGGLSDCDDSLAQVYPNAPETCDALDNDCDLAADEDFDADSDGAYTALDANCATSWPSGLLDCDDAEPAVRPGLVENCSNGIDDNCNGSIDEDEDLDLDGVTTCAGDCNDDEGTTYPGAPELCNQLDDDCNGPADDGFDDDLDLWFDGSDAGCVATYGTVDCNDGDPAIQPAATELCDGVDQDCNGVIDGPFDVDGDTFFDGANADCVLVYPVIDCDDSTAAVSPTTTEACDGLDNDCDAAIDDGFDLDGDLAFDGAVAGCAGVYGADADCNDADVAVAPGAPELCNGMDDDCNGAVPLAEVDNDLDGYVECDNPIPSGSWTPAGGSDCDDGSAARRPGAAELCNQADDDCDGGTDEDFDLDLDTFVDAGVPACEVAWSEDLLDCDDTNAAVAPFQVEICDALDQDCDGSVDESFDVDGDGTFDGLVPDCAAAYPDPDCDDTNPLAFPFNFEDCGNGIDDNCNGAIDEDTDADGDGRSTCGGDCNDDDASVYLNAAEVCDLADQDCDFTADEDFDGDADGYITNAVPDCAVAYAGDPLDCDDTDASIRPDVVETCDGVDEDCDTSIDEVFDLDGDLWFDRFAPGCVATYGGGNTDCDDADPGANPGGTEVCNAIDDDCDTIADEGFDGDQDGVWDGSDSDCQNTYGSLGALDCDDSDDTIFPSFDGGVAATELCDGEDNDCNAVIEEDLDEDGFFGATVEVCEGEDDLDCDDEDSAVNVDAEEVCDDIRDNDCDGLSDLDDPECETGDDDDSTPGDDDDSSPEPTPEPTPDPELVENGDADPILAAGCSMEHDGTSGGSVVAAALVMILLRRRPSRRRVGALVLALLVASPLLAPSRAEAQGALEMEAQRQLDYAWNELREGKFEKAIQSADSALRLNPALYSAMVIKALAYEGSGEFRRAESWLQTYLDLTASLSQAPEAMALADRLKSKMGGSTSGGKVTAQATVRTGKDYGAFGDGFVHIGGSAGGRAFSQTPCDVEAEGCTAGAEGRPGFWAFSGSGFSGGLAARAEYFFVGGPVGVRARWELGAPLPIDSEYEVAQGEGPDQRLDVGVALRLPLRQGSTKVKLLLDAGYGLRTWEAYENLNATQATKWEMEASEIVGGAGLRIEPGRVIGLEGRLSFGGLIGAGGGGINEIGGEVAAAIRPVERLMARVGFDLRSTRYYGERLQGEEVVARAESRDLVAGLMATVGVAF